MKIIRPLAIVFCLFLMASAKAQVSTPDAIVNKLFAALQAKDEKAFLALYPNAAQMKSMMKSMMEQMMKSDQMKQMMAMDERSKNLNVDSLINAEVSKMDSPEAFQEMQKTFAQSYKSIIQKGEKKGVKWNEAKLLRHTIDTSMGSDALEQDILKGSGIKNMKGVIEFQVGDSLYHMSFDKILFIPSENGWFGGEFPQLARKGESLAPDQNTDDIIKSDIKQIDPSYKLPEQPTKTKVKKSGTETKVKTKTSTTKSKTKTKAKS